MRADLQELQSTINREFPLCAAMGLQIHQQDENGLVLRAPLINNHNHRLTGFAGSLNSLCTVAGWGTVFLLAHQHQILGTIVIRRSTIDYSKPVLSQEILARCSPVSESQRLHFVEMFRRKGQGKIDLQVEIATGQERAVLFHGSYVVSTPDQRGLFVPE